MPERRRTALVDGQRVGVEEITVELEVVTPILGGGTKTRDVDEVDIIRVPTIRGHLRFWWRALYGQNYDSPRALYAAEKRLWGGTTDGDDESGGRSLVEVTVSVDKQRAAAVDESQIQAYGTDATPGAYA
ncbi:MAG TPA: type III-B CRISPR module RAMP protein Cmr1, partial [Armatimonadetes bacterium]|nr:type III-B CRISPR module RAMP protein Cmr1 [Armatimonadota bacterium]